jgi:hypothetical protein
MKIKKVKVAHVRIWDQLVGAVANNDAIKQKSIFVP